MPTEDQNSHAVTWEEVRERLREHLGTFAIESWFGPLGHVITEASGVSTLCLVAPSNFHREWIVTNYLSSVETLWEEWYPGGTVRLTVQATPAAVPARSTLARAIQFPLFPEETRPVANDMARSALFSCVQGKDRQMMEKTLLATVEGVEIRFTGRQCNQDDHDVLMQLVFMARHKPLGEAVTIPAHAILKSLGRGTSGKEHQQLHDEIERLVVGTVHIKNRKRKVEYIGHLLDKAAQDETTRHWVYALNPDLSVFYSRDAYTLIDLKKRQDLRGKDLARWLQLYLASHAAPFPVSVAYLHEKCGSSMKTLRDFRRQLRLALASLESNKDIISWHIDEQDLVVVDRVPSPAQALYLSDKRTDNRGGAHGK